MLGVRRATSVNPFSLRRCNLLLTSLSNNIFATIESNGLHSILWTYTFLPYWPIVHSNHLLCVSELFYFFIIFLVCLVSCATTHIHVQNILNRRSAKCNAPWQSLILDTVTTNIHTHIITRHSAIPRNSSINIIACDSMKEYLQ